MALGTRRAPLSPGRLARRASRPDLSGATARRRRWSMPTVAGREFRAAAKRRISASSVARGLAPATLPASLNSSLFAALGAGFGARGLGCRPMLATIDAYNVSLFLHISAVVIGFGATYAEAILFPVAMKVDKRHLPYV